MERVTPHKTRLTAIIPTYNRSKLCSEAVQSIFDQKDPVGVRVIVVDNGSTDDTVANLRSKFAAEIGSDRLRVLEISYTGDPAKARNRGIIESDSEWVAFLDSDDLWLPGRIEELAPLLDQYDLILTPGRAVEAPRDWVRAYIHMNLGNTSTVAVRRSQVLEVGGFAEDYFGPKKRILHGFEDYELWLKLLLNLKKTDKMDRFMPLYTDRVQTNFQPGGIGRMKIREQMFREANTLGRLLPVIPMEYWGLVGRRLAGAAKACFLK